MFIPPKSHIFAQPFSNSPWFPRFSCINLIFHDLNIFISDAEMCPYLLHHWNGNTLGFVLTFLCKTTPMENLILEFWCWPQMSQVGYVLAEMGCLDSVHERLFVSLIHVCEHMSLEKQGNQGPSTVLTYRACLAESPCPDFWIFLWYNGKDVGFLLVSSWFCPMSLPVVDRKAMEKLTLDLD